MNFNFIFNRRNIVCISFIFVLIFITYFFSENIKIKEDGFIEWMSAIFHLSSAYIAIIIYKTSNYKILSCFWILFSIFCFGEECSWLQRQLKYSIPEVEERNRQGEFNIHNLEIFESQRLVSKEGNFQFNYKILFSSQFLFLIGLFIYFLIIPICLNYFDFLQKYFPPIETKFLFIFWTLFILSYFLSINKSYVMRNTFAETRECVFSAFIFLHQIYLRKNTLLFS
ncbi:MAG: hypothetical protein RLZZ546_2366 [Bacteroidota bacterium]|jgi:hypothetical protein